MIHQAAQEISVPLSKDRPNESQIFGFCLVVPVLPITSSILQAATTTNYAEWTYPDGGNGGKKERDWYQDTD